MAVDGSNRRQICDMLHRKGHFMDRFLTFLTYQTFSRSAEPFCFLCCDWSSIFQIFPVNCWTSNWHQPLQIWVHCGGTLYSGICLFGWIASWCVWRNIDNFSVISSEPWWRHQMETFSTLLAICAGNSPVHGEFPTQRPVTRSFDVFFDLLSNKRLSKQWRGWWFETQSCPLWRHRNVYNGFSNAMAAETYLLFLFLIYFHCFSNWCGNYYITIFPSLTHYITILHT